MTDSLYSDWRHYQEATATVFRDLGYSAIVDSPIQGTRSTHRVDVEVTFGQHGIDCRWIVECKLWKDRVEKADILILKGVVDDVGADRGIIFCENGFQSGAVDAARNTNITLQTCLNDFRRTAGSNRPQAALARLEGEPGSPPVYAFPNREQPQHLMLYGNSLFVANWQAGNIAIVDPKAKSIEGVIELDKYEVRQISAAGGREIAQYPPGNMACADGKIFVGQIFSEFVLAIDIATQAIVKRIAVPGGGEGAIIASRNGKYVYFASNRANRLCIIDSATYELEEVEFPTGGRGCLCILAHPSKPLLYLGIQRGGTLDGKSYPYGNCFLATYDLAERRYVGNLYLAEIENGRSDDAMPICLTFDEEDRCLYVGMFQSMRGICRVDELGCEILEDFRFVPNAHNRHFRWVDPLSQSLHRGSLLTVNRNNCELVTLDKRSGRVEAETFLGAAPNGPTSIVVADDVAIISYPERRGLIFHGLYNQGLV